MNYHTFSVFFDVCIMVLLGVSCLKWAIQILRHGWNDEDDDTLTEEETRVIEAAQNLARAGSQINTEIPSNLLHELYDAVRAYEAAP
jgi:hypothetical protein